MCNLEEIGQEVSEKKTKVMRSYIFIAQGQGQVTPGDKILFVVKKIIFPHTKVSDSKFDLAVLKSQRSSKGHHFNIVYISWLFRTRF